MTIIISIMIKIKEMKDNIMIQYTIISLIVTLAIGYFLIDNLLKSTQSHSIEIHTQIYIDFIQAIPKNYPTIFDVLDNNIKKEVSDNHPSENTNHNNIDFDHFITDLLIFPKLTEVNIYSKNRSLIFELYITETGFIKEHDNKILNKAYNGENLHFIHELPRITILHTFLPVFKNNEVIGVVEIIDSDESFTKYLKESKKNLRYQVILSGFIFYIILFSLFFRAYLSQKKGLDRLNRSQELTIHAMSLLAELRDNDTGSHIMRTQEYCKILALELSKTKKYKKYLTKDYIDDLVRSAPLHDVGKVGVPDNILLKPGKLNSQEFELIKKHPGYGAEVLSRVAERLDFKSYFTIGIQLVLHHHENWDGSGYPIGLAGHNIPLSARIMSIADVYDALRTKRPYKEPMSHFKAIDIITNDSGIKFDPDIVNALNNIESDFDKISNKTL